jgi:hypothetical protein
MTRWMMRECEVVREIYESGQCEREVGAVR